jgi:hypothetical protein
MSQVLVLSCLWMLSWLILAESSSARKANVTNGHKHRDLILAHGGYHKKSPENENGQA